MDEVLQIKHNAFVYHVSKIVFFITIEKINFVLAEIYDIRAVNILAVLETKTKQNAVVLSCIIHVRTPKERTASSYSIEYYIILWL